MAQRLQVPTYRRKGKTGLAVVTLPDGRGGRRDVYLGKYGTAASRAEYGRVLAEWEAANRTLPQLKPAPDLTIAELLVRYYEHAVEYYRKDGEPTSQLSRIRLAMKPVKVLYGRAAAAKFGPLALKAAREWMIAQGWTRGFINACIGCIKRIFKWAVANELVQPPIYQGLQAVAGLARGRTEASEPEPITPADDAHVDAVLPYLPRAVAAMVQIQRLAGMRPSEVCLMRGTDIDQGGPAGTWVYRPARHKTEHHGINRAVCLGPRAQQILRPWLERDPEAYLFSPKEMMAEWRAKQRKERQSKVQPSQLRRAKRRPRKSPGDHYTRDSYRQAIDRAIVRANRDQACPQCKNLEPADRCEACQAEAILHWHPNQLRHTAATEVRRVAGLDAAQAMLGHRSADITEIYAELGIDKAAQIAAKLG